MINRRNLLKIGAVSFLIPFVGIPETEAPQAVTFPKRQLRWGAGRVNINNHNEWFAFDDIQAFYTDHVLDKITFSGVNSKSLNMTGTYFRIVFVQWQYYEHPEAVHFANIHYSHLNDPTDSKLAHLSIWDKVI